MASEKPQSSFTEMRILFMEEIDTALDSCDISCIRSKWNTFEARDMEKRSALEQALRDKTMKLMNDSINDSFALAKFLNFVMTLCKQELAFPVLSVMLLSDVLDSATIPICENLFEFVEGHVGTWKTPQFFGPCKNNILRMCNDLLRRLSKAQNTVFCGRILLFLAMFFPFSERSGLNIVSEFNTDKDNFMKYEVEVDEDEEEEPLQTAEAAVILESNFYSEFWGLQEYFRSPTLCYNKNHWKDFVKNTNAVLTVLKNYKLEYEPRSVDSLKKNQMFFTKFLTNQKLLLLQLSDTDFRRTIYLQFLILFQFLSAQLKTKQEELKPDQLEWVKSAAVSVNQLIKDSPPDGEQFFEVVQLIMKREEHWSHWKNDGCPALKKVMPNYDKTAIQKTLDVTETVADVMAQQKSTNILVVPRKKGDEIVTEVVDMRQNYLQCLPGRNVSPNIQDFLAEAIQQSENPDLEIKDKKVNDQQFAWIALKLLSMKSPHFFSVNQTPIPKLPDFVDHICRRIFREQNPGMLLPPLMPAPKQNAKPEVKKGSEDKTSGKEPVKGQKVVKMSKNQVVRTASGKLIKVDANTAVKTLQVGDQIIKIVKPKAVPTSVSDETNGSGGKVDSKNVDKDKTSDHEKTAKIVDSSTDKDKNDGYDRSERYEKGKSEKSSAGSDKLNKSDKSKPPVVSRDKTNSDAKTKQLSSDKDRVLSRKEKEKSPVKRKRDADFDRDTKKPSRDKREERREDRDLADAPSLTSEQIEKLSKSISGSWKKVAEKLGYKSDEIEYFTSKRDNDFDRALNLLLVWASTEEDATPENLYRCLKSLSLTEAMKIIG